MNVNKVILIGRVGNDPKIHNFENDNSVAKFSLATSETFKNKDNKKITNTQWHNVVVWGGLAKVVEKYVKKGDALYIEGKLVYRHWDDKDGNKKYTTEVVGSDMRMLGGKKSDSDKKESSKEKTGDELEIPETPPEQEIPDNNLL